MTAALPNPPPASPVALIQAWIDEARRSSERPNPNAVTLATADASGHPAARVVLIKHLDNQGFGVFYTHYDSPKAVQLAGNSRAAGVLHFDRLGRQIRLRGQVMRSPAEESDAYFAGRPFMSQLNAWVSKQSQSIEHPDDLVEVARTKAAEWGVVLVHRNGALEPDETPQPLPRPPNWGGYRFWFSDVELWLSRSGRFHHRLHYSRSLRENDGEYDCGEWRYQWLQP